MILHFLTEDALKTENFVFARQEKGSKRRHQITRCPWFLLASLDNSPSPPKLFSPQFLLLAYNWVRHLLIEWVEALVEIYNKFETYYSGSPKIRTRVCSHFLWKSLFFGEVFFRKTRNSLFFGKVLFFKIIKVLIFWKNAFSERAKVQKASGYLQGLLIDEIYSTLYHTICMFQKLIFTQGYKF